VTAAPPLAPDNSAVVGGCALAAHAPARGSGLGRWLGLALGCALLRRRSRLERRWRCGTLVRHPADGRATPATPDCGVILY
jgi:hypothetical protein